MKILTNVQARSYKTQFDKKLYLVKWIERNFLTQIRFSPFCHVEEECGVGGDDNAAGRRWRDDIGKERKGEEEGEEEDEG